MRGVVLSLIAGVFMPLFASSPANPPFPPVTGFDLERYLGTWYEIARFPHSFEKGLDNVTATYSLRADGLVEVVNKGYKNGEERKATGKAKLAGSPQVGHLKVSFFLFFYSDYIIVELDSSYSCALVVGANTDYLWILAREPTLPPDTVNRLTARARELGFDMSRLIMVDQSRYRD
jgi:apolipoprotein D and lipocalin family protein